MRELETVLWSSNFLFFGGPSKTSKESTESVFATWDSLGFSWTENSRKRVTFGPKFGLQMIWKTPRRPTFYSLNFKATANGLIRLTNCVSGYDKRRVRL